MYLPVPGFEPTSSVFLEKYATRYATVADGYMEGQRKPVHTVDQGSIL